MCVAIPCRVKSIEGLRAAIEVGGVQRKISIEFTPEVKPDDYVLVHAGFAIHIIDEQEAMETLQLLAEMEELEKIEVH